MTARGFVLALFMLAAGVSLAAQAQRDRQTPARDKAAEPSGTAVITGIVVTNDERPQPVRRVSVMLASGQVVTPRTAVTDDEGRFVFTALAAGNYTLVGQKPAWVTSVYGARGPSDTQGMPIAVLDGQRVDGVRLPMMRGAVVAGTVRSAAGKPAQRLAIQVMQVRHIEGRRQLTMVAAPGETNDLGAYRVFGLPPGEYVVQARSAPGPTGGELRQVSDAEVRWADERVAQGLEPVPVGATASLPPPPPPPGPAVTYSTVFFPGTAYVSDAAVLSLRAGEERTNVDFMLSLVPTARVTGAVIGPDGVPVAGAVVAMEAENTGDGDLLGLMVGLIGGRTTARPDGTFTLSGVVPGRYTLTARATPRRPGPPQAGAPADAAMAEALAMASAMAGMFGGGADNPATLWAAEPLVISGQDVGPLSMSLREGLTMEGSLVVEGGGTPPDASTLRMTVSKAASGDAVASMVGRMLTSASGQAKEDGTFAVRGLTPGRYQVSVTGKSMRMNTLVPGLTPAQTGWVVKSIRWNDQDLADTGIDLQADVPVTGVVVTLTNQPAQLAGTVIDAAGRPTGAFPIVVFSMDRAHWGPGSRRVLQAQPASDGRFTVVGLPAGDYFLAAVTRLEPGDLANRQFLEDLLSASLRITIRDREQKTQDLKLSGGG